MPAAKVLAALAATAVSAVGSITQGMQAKSVADFNATLALRQAEREREIAERDADSYQRRQSRLLASARAGRAASGVRMTGTPLLTDDAMIDEIELGAATIKAGGEARASSLSAEAKLQRLRGRSARTTGFMRAGGSLLSGAGRTFG